MTHHPTPHAFYQGRVFHRRLIAPKYQFAYRVFNVCLDIDRIESLSDRLSLFSYNRFNLFSFYDRDHLIRDTKGRVEPGALRHWAESGLKEHGIDLQGGRIRLFCYPRILGFVFNPLSVWYCEDNQGSLVAILCEVRNTFGERHCYLLREPSGGALDLATVHHHPKRFHVSPFLPVSGDYEFRFSEPSQKLDVSIVWLDEGERAMIATQRMTQVPINDWALLKTFFVLPLMTLKVVAAIHWQALKIWIRGARFYKKPTPPQKEISSDV
ncbi:MAG TPA: DUF1365 domain-containing protein [Wenzhouxiangella sp.]